MAESERAAVKRLTHVAIAALLVFSACVLLAQLPSDYSWLANHNRIPGHGLVVDYRMTDEAENYTDGAAQQLCKNWAPGASVGNVLQRGSTTGSDTNDPTVGSTGWTFDGVNDYGTMLSIERLPSGNASRTMIALIDWTSSSTTQQEALSYGPSGAVNNTSFGFLLNGVASANALIINNTYGTTAWFLTGAIVSRNTWHVLSVSTTSATSLVKAWVDKGFSNSATRTYSTSTKRFNIGRFGPGSSAYFGGVTSRVLLYDRALSDKEVQVVYAALMRWAAQRGISLP